MNDNLLFLDYALFKPYEFPTFSKLNEVAKKLMLRVYNYYFT